jgi:hypothetical protein
MGPLRRRTPPRQIRPGDSIGFGYEPASASVFSHITMRGSTNAFGEVYVPRGKYDAYAATGVGGG